MQSLPPSRAGRGVFVPLALLLLVAACSPEVTEAPKAPAGPAGRLGTAVVSGRVALTGVPPVNDKVTMTTDPFCAGHNPGETELPAYAVGADGALANVLLRVTAGVTASWPGSARSAAGRSSSGTSTRCGLPERSPGSRSTPGATSRPDRGSST